MSEIAAAVIGAGRLGAFHADKYLATSGLRLKYVVDTDHARAERVAAKAGATILSDYRELAGKVELGSCAATAADRWDFVSEAP